MSGGQQQRVAVARALVLEPEVLLFDEPLSNLDARLRRSMREEIRALQQRLGLTVVYVTHDQAEALAVSDRIVVMRNAEIAQAGTPAELYTAARLRLRRDLHGRGEPRAAARITAIDGRRWRAWRSARCDMRLPHRGLPPGPVDVVIRPEAIRLQPAATRACPPPSRARPTWDRTRNTCSRPRSASSSWSRRTGCYGMRAGAAVAIGLDPEGVVLVRP